MSPPSWLWLIAPQPDHATFLGSFQCESAPFGLISAAAWPFARGWEVFYVNFCYPPPLENYGRGTALYRAPTVN
jgi:hypothetical protein